MGPRASLGPLMIAALLGFGQSDEVATAPPEPTPDATPEGVPEEALTIERWLLDHLKADLKPPGEPCPGSTCSPWP